MAFPKLGYLAFILLTLVWSVKTAENNIRLTLLPNSNRSGRVEVFGNGVWGTVCDDRFTVDNAMVACKQLGYTTGVGFARDNNGGSGLIALDNVNCRPYDIRLQDCEHEGWGNHNCYHSEDVGVICAGGTREIVSNLILRADHYWDCDHFSPGVQYDFKNGKKVVLHGTATLASSPINSGFRLEGQSSWVNLGDFSDEPCLRDPSNCSLTVSVWLKIYKRTNQRTFILGNSYNKTKIHGFSIYMENHEIKGYVLGSQKLCEFSKYHISQGYWFHFALQWHRTEHVHVAYKHGQKAGKQHCLSGPQKVSFIDTVYTMGVDETLAGNANRDLDIAFDELTIWYSQLSHDEINSFMNLARDWDGVSLNELTLKLPEKPWVSSYSTSSSTAYNELHNEISNQLKSIYQNLATYQSFEIKSLENSDGVLKMSLQLNYSSVAWEHGYYLQKSFEEGYFLNSAADILDCKSIFEYCATPKITSVTAKSDGWHLNIRFQPDPQKVHSGTLEGYFAYAKQVDGSITGFAQGAPHHFTTTNLAIKLCPNTNFTIIMGTFSFKGRGFLMGNSMFGHTLQAAPGSGPTHVRAINIQPTDVSVTWSTISHHQHGIIHKYRVTLVNSAQQVVGSTYVNVTEERLANFSGLLAGNTYEGRVCGYTVHPDCGKEQVTGWFKTVPRLPAGPPRNLKLLSVTPHRVHLQWLAVARSLQNGHMINYNLHFKNLRTGSFEKYVNYSISRQDQESFDDTFSNLKGLTPYKVQISLSNEVGIGPSQNLTFMTNESVPEQAPENFTVLNVSTDTISVRWSSIHREYTNGILLGYHLYYKIANLSDFWSNVTSDNSTLAVLVTPLEALRTYELRLCGFTAVGDGVFTPTVMVSTPGEAPLNRPTDARVIGAGNDSLVVEWRYISPQPRPAQFFVVTATRVETKTTEVRSELDVFGWPGDVYQYTVEGLKEFKWYDVHIAAGNIAGVANFSYVPVRNRTLEGVPSASPRNLTAVNESSTSMLLQWEPVLREYQDGIIRGYVVYWRLANVSDIGWESLHVNGSSNTSVAIDSLKKFEYYEFKVSAFTSVGEGETTWPVVASTDEDVPSHPPPNVTGRNTSSRSLLVTWGPVPAQWHFGIMRGYQVLLIDTNNGNTHVHEAAVNETSLEAGGLERYTNYSVQVAAFTIKGPGNFSEPIIVITDEDVPSDGPPNIICTDTSSTGLSIRWSVLPVTKAHGIVRSYKIFLKRSDGRGHTMNDTLPSVIRNTSFFNLDEYVEYTVEILGTTIKGEGSRSAPVYCLTDEDIPHDFPRGLYGYNTSDTKIKVFWQDVPNDDKNGIITGYTLFYNTTLRSGEILYSQKHLGPVKEHELTGLLPFKYYDIKVAASTSKGMGPKSNFTTVLTEEEAPKVPPGDVKAFNTSSTSITMTWQPIPPENVGGIVRGYKILWEEVNYRQLVILQNQTRLDNVSYTSHTFYGLTKYQEYRFRIQAFTKFLGVASSPLSTFTDEDIPSAPPTNCSGFNISKNEIRVIWDVVPRPDRNGIVLGYNIYSDETLNHVSFNISEPNTSPPTYIEYHNLTVMNTTGYHSRSFVLDNLIPYTDYSFEIVAFTSKGEGPRCQHFVVRTEEEAPRFPPSDIKIHNTSSTSLNVTWIGIPLSLIRGVFRGYDIWFTAYPQFPDAYLTYGEIESKRKRRAVFTLDGQLITVGVENETLELTGLAKYTNYSIQVMGLTKFVGIQSRSIEIMTDEDKPSRTPQNFHGYNLSSTSLQLKWSPVQDGFVHGILLGYRIYYRITDFPLKPLVNVTYGPTTLNTTLRDLFMYTNYTLQITAFTIKGEGPYTQPIMVTTDEDVASKSPFGFKVVNLIKTHEIPMFWHPVPDGFLNGILTGYRIKVRQLAQAMENVNGREVHIDLEPDVLNYTFQNLPNFATFTFQIVALTKYGEGVHSSVKTARTCPCEKNLTTNWFSLPPYTNKTEYEETGIFPWLIDNLVTTCCGNCYNGHGWSNTLYKVDGKGADGFKYKISSFKENIDDDTDFSFPVQGSSLQDKYATFYSYIFTLATPGVAFFVVDDPPDKMPNAILSTVSNSWAILLFAVIFSLASGIVLWFMDTATNEIEFPRKFFKGAGEGFWWAFISMTTVGYGDRTPQSIPARLFAIFWVLCGLVLTSILMGSLTNALTTITFDEKNIMLYGTKVAAIDDSPSHRIGIRRNARINEDTIYNNAFEIQEDLLKRKVKGALLDGYMAGSYNDLFQDEHIRIHEIIDYKTGYGIVLGGQSRRLHKCFKNYVKTKRSYIVDHIAKEVKTVRKNPVSPAEAQSTNLFNPKADVFVHSMASALGMLLAAVVAGLCLQVYFNRRFRNKVEGSNEIHEKQLIQGLSESLESFRERMALLKEELFCKHTNELRTLSDIKRRPVEYNILPHLEEDNSNCNELYPDWSSTTFLITPTETSLNKFDEESEKTTVVEPSDQSPADSSSQLPLFVSVCQSDIETAGIVDNKPDIEDLQREAYLAGLRAEGSNDSGHPYAKMYRYLWLEKGLYEEDERKWSDSSDDDV